MCEVILLQSCHMKHQLQKSCPSTSHRRLCRCCIQYCESNTNSPRYKNIRSRGQGRGIRSSLPELTRCRDMRSGGLQSIRSRSRQVSANTSRLSRSTSLLMGNPPQADLKNILAIEQILIFCKLSPVALTQFPSTLNQVNTQKGTKQNSKSVFHCSFGLQKNFQRIYCFIGSYLLV